jgi:cell division septation protein DedD
LNSDFDPTLLSAGFFILVVISIITNLVRNKRIKEGRRQHESLMSRLSRPIIEIEPEQIEAGQELRELNNLLKQFLAGLSGKPSPIHAPESEPAPKPKPKPKPAPKPKPKPKPQPTPQPQNTTSDEIIQEVIAALVKLGHTKTSAKKIISELCKNSTFDGSEELLQAAFSK